jgi:hypothetical protein
MPAKRSWWPRMASPGRGWCRWKRIDPVGSPGCYCFAEAWRLRGQLQLPPIDVLLAPLPPEELDALEAPLPS